MADAGRIADLRRTIRLSGVLAWTALRGEAQYRANFLMISSGLIYQAVGIGFIWVILTRFETIGDWHLPEMAFLYGIRLTAHGLWFFPFSRVVDALDILVQTAEFDRFLVRPLNPLIQAATSKLWLGPIGDIVGGVAVLAVAVTLVDVDWSPIAIIYLGLAILGGALIEFGVNLALASLTFRLFAARALVRAAFAMFDNGYFPISIFGAAGQFALTYVMPLAFMAYVPASVLLDRTDELNVAPAVAYGAPLVGVIVFVLAYQLWRNGLRHYSSAGT